MHAQRNQGRPIFIIPVTSQVSVSIITDNPAAAAQAVQSIEPNRANALRSAAFTVFLTILALAPLWYGSFGIVPVAVLTLALAILSLLYSFIAKEPQGSRTSPLMQVRVPALCLTIILLFALVQALMPMPALLANPVWGLAQDVLGIAGPHVISVAPVATLLSATHLAGLVLCFWLAFQFGQNAKRGLTGIAAIALIVLAYTVWGLADHLLRWNMILFEPKDVYALDTLNGFVSGTFRNRDHFAAYCTIGLLCAATLALYWARKIAEGARHDSIESREGALFILWVTLMPVFAAAIWLSRSRSMIFLACVGLFAFIIMLAWRSARSGARRPAIILAASSFAALLLMLVLVLEDSSAAARFALTGDAIAGRLAVYKLTIKGILLNPVLGVGFGAFADAFPIYRTVDTGFGGFWNAAHNIYLETAFGLGIPAALLFLTGLGWCVRRVLIGALTRRTQFSAPLAAASVSFVLLAHGLVDFSLQTPAIALTYAALLGFGCAQSWSRKEGQRPLNRRRKSSNAAMD